MSSRFKIKEKSLKANRKVPVEVPEPQAPEVGDLLTLRRDEIGAARRAHTQAMREYRQAVDEYKRAARVVDTPISSLDTFINGPGEAFLRALIRAKPVAPIEIETDEATIVIEVKPNTADE